MNHLGQCDFSVNSHFDKGVGHIMTPFSFFIEKSFKSLLYNRSSPSVTRCSWKIGTNVSLQKKKKNLKKKKIPKNELALPSLQI